MAVTDFLTYIGYPYPEDHFHEACLPAACQEFGLATSAEGTVDPEIYAGQVNRFGSKVPEAYA